MTTTSAPFAHLADVASPSPRRVEVDDLDLTLLRALAVDARQSQRALARAVGMSPPAIADRLARLERTGAIRGYRADIDWAALGYPVVVYLAVTAGPGMDLSEIIRAIRALPEAQDMSVVTGGLDLLVRLRVRDHAHLRELLLGYDLPDSRRAAHGDLPVARRHRAGQLRGSPARPDEPAEPAGQARRQGPGRPGRHGTKPERSAPGEHCFPRIPRPARRPPASASPASSPGTACSATGRPARREVVAARIRELGLRTVRFIVVDQHGMPRSKSLSADAALAVLSNGLDFSGAIYSLDTGNQVFVPAFAQGGGFGIEEFTGFPDVVLVPDPTTFRVLPWADRTGWMLCDVYFGNGQPMPLDGRGLMRRVLGELAEAGYDYLAGIEIEYYIVKLESDRITPENAGFTPPPPEVSVFERGYQYLSEVRLDSVGEHARGDQGRACTRWDCRRGPWRTSGARARWSSASARSAGWPRPTRSCCSGPRSSRSASAAACSPRSCAARRCRTSSPRAGTCTSR